ncbi:hypothetical protein ACFDTO_23270 [Microbacteriaceae bacterium 4G12]
MQISLIRHGRSIVHSDFMNVEQFQAWIEQYNQEGIRSEAKFPPKTVAAIESAKFILSSDSKQAIQSATLLTHSLSFIQNKIFREAEIATYVPMPTWLKLKPRLWLTLGRTFWLVGYGEDVETYDEAKFRAKQAADLLIGYALCYQKVVLIGHRFFNMMIAKELRQRGWTGPLFLNQQHWGCTTYQYHKVLEGPPIKQSIGFTPMQT